MYQPVPPHLTQYHQEPTNTARFSFVDLRWAQLYVSLVPYSFPIISANPRCKERSQWRRQPARSSSERRLWNLCLTKYDLCHSPLKHANIVGNMVYLQVCEDYHSSHLFLMIMKVTFWLCTGLKGSTTISQRSSMSGRTGGVDLMSIWHNFIVSNVILIKLNLTLKRPHRNYINLCKGEALLLNPQPSHCSNKQTRWDIIIF